MWGVVIAGDQPGAITEISGCAAICLKRNEYPLKYHDISVGNRVEFQIPPDCAYS